MNVSTNDRPTPQLGFDFIPVPADITSVNRPGATSSIDFISGNPSGIKAGDALSRMFVDDRVFRLGKTNWRQLLEHALASGHTELYLSEDARHGLRMPGYRFGPITRMPAQGPEYVKRTLLGKAFAKLQAQGVPVRSGRTAAAGGFKVEWTVDGAGLELGIFDGRRRLGSTRFRLEELPVGDGFQQEDLERQGEHIAARAREVAPEGFGEALGKAAANALASFLSPQGKQS